MTATGGEFEKGGRELLRTARRLAISLSLVCAVFMAAELGLHASGARFESPGRFAAGLAAGWACSMTKVCMMARSFLRMMTSDGKRAGTRFTLDLASRYIVTAAASVTVLFFAGTFGPAGFLGGLLSMPIGGYLENRAR
ncbi:MAG: hypothetical protein LBR87_01965 [Synergistaceae bacterium]|jgi:hypothetical protein|nr:hypothetical protein [Synergistaceae bacterium]